ncbi:hypothetical protein NDU88_005932 [Pleurodeles waltl]|uniref:Uncharacterized protein n=1 Tax=Pleurodeles waltl TaxID=8319 RepID=A0AAV7LQY4_PLEWA|nr:hypothetical protein NDU88_005932 [Pleurodeles waltl]
MPVRALPLWPPLGEERLAPKSDRGRGAAWTAAWALRRAFLRRLPGPGDGGAEGLEDSFLGPASSGTAVGASAPGPTSSLDAEGTPAGMIGSGARDRHPPP